MLVSFLVFWGCRVSEALGGKCTGTKALLSIRFFLFFLVRFFKVQNVKEESFDHSPPLHSLLHLLHKHHIYGITCGYGHRLTEMEHCSTALTGSTAMGAIATMTALSGFVSTGWRRPKTKKLQSRFRPPSLWSLISWFPAIQCPRPYLGITRKI